MTLVFRKKECLLKVWFKSWCIYKISHFGQKVIFVCKYYTAHFVFTNIDFFAGAEVSFWTLKMFLAVKKSFSHRCYSIIWFFIPKNYHIVSFSQNNVTIVFQLCMVYLKSYLKHFYRIEMVVHGQCAMLLSSINVRKKASWIKMHILNLNQYRFSW